MNASKLSASQKGFAPILIILGIILILGVTGGAYYFGKVQNTKTQPQITVTPAPLVKIDETTNWTIYTNTEYGFLLKYPSQDGWEVSGNINDTIPLKADNEFWVNIPNSDTIALSLYIYSSKLDIQAWWNREGEIKFSKLAQLYTNNMPIFNQTPTTISGKPALFTQGSIDAAAGPFGGGYLIYMVSNNGKIYMLVGRNSLIFQNGLSRVKSEDLFNQILSTFKFTDQKTSLDTQIINIIATKMNVAPAEIKIGTPRVENENWIATNAGVIGSAAAYIFQKNGTELELVYYGQECPSKELIAAKKIPSEILATINSSGCK